MKVTFKKSHQRKLRKWVVGEKSVLDLWLAKELIEKGIVEEYTGPWPPPKRKMKFNLKDLK